jgi:hypothetical protein
VAAFVDEVSAALAEIKVDALSAEDAAFVASMRAAPPRRHAELLAMLPTIPRALAYDIAPLLLEPPRSLPAGLAALLGHADARFAHAALRALLDRPRAPALPLLVDALRRHPDPDVRWGACHTLAFTWPRGWPAAAHRGLLAALRETADDVDEAPHIRGQALEGIANRFGSPLAPADAAIVLRALEDPHPAVRFWGCFAAWQTHATSCAPRLKWLAEHDATRPPLLWPVAVEAADALGSFEEPPRRARDHALIQFGSWLPALPIRRGAPPFAPDSLLDALRVTLLSLLRRASRPEDEDVPEDMDESSQAIEAAGRAARVEAAPELDAPPHTLGARLLLASEVEPVRDFLLSHGLEREPGSADVLRGWYAAGVSECLVRVELRGA